MVHLLSKGLRTEVPRTSPRFLHAPSRAAVHTPSGPSLSALRRPAPRASMPHDGPPAKCRQLHPRRDTPHSRHEAHRELEKSKAKPATRRSIDATRSEEHTSELQSPCNLVC